MADELAPQSFEYTPLEALHRAGEDEQKRLVPQIAAAGPAALPVLIQAYHEIHPRTLISLWLTNRTLPSEGASTLPAWRAPADPPTLPSRSSTDCQ